MRLEFVAALTVCCACAHQPGLSQSVHLARQGLHAATPALEAIPQEQWAQDLRNAQARCEQEELRSEADRIDCLGLPYQRAVLVEKLQELYDQIATLLDEAEDVARALEALQ